MKGKVKLMILTLLIAICLSIISIWLQRRAVNATPKITIYKVNKTIEVGSPITINDIEKDEASITSDISSYIKSETELKDIIVKETIYEGERINKNRLTSKDDNKIFISEEGKRQFSIPTIFIDDPYVQALKKGDIVDIILTEGIQSSSGIPKSTVMLEKARVLGAIDNNGQFITGKNQLATAILFESTTNIILDVTEGQYLGKYKFIKVPNNEK